MSMTVSDLSSRFDEIFQNIFRKVKKWSKFRQDQKSMASAFAYFLTTIAKYLFMEGRLSDGTIPATFNYFSVFLNFLKS